MATPDQQKAPVQGATSEQVSSATSAEAPIDAANASPHASLLPLSIEYWGNADCPDAVLYGIKGAHTPGDLFRSLAAVDPDLVRMLAEAQKDKRPCFSPEFIRELEEEESEQWLKDGSRDLAETPPAGAEPAPGFERMGPEEQLKCFLDAVGIGPHEQFVLSARFECRDDKNPDKWCERWTHQTAQRMGTSGDAWLSNTLCYGKHEPSDGSKGKLSGWRQKKSQETRNWEYFLRTAVFELDSDKKLRSFEQNNVKRRRDYFVEADGIPLTEQRRRVEQYEAGGLKFNACVFSGNKSLQLRIKRPRGWHSTPEKDRWIDKVLCVLFDGDTQAQTLNQAARMPGFKREGKHEQRLLWATNEVLYASYDELRGTLERLLTQSGVEDLEAAYDALAAKQGKAKQQRDIDARKSSELGRQWDEWTGWTDGDRRKAATFDALTADNLIGLMPKRAQALVHNGSEAGCRWDDGTYLTLELRGVVDVLSDLGVPKVDELAKVVLERFVTASGGDVDEARLFEQYDGAEGAMPGKPPESFLSSLSYETRGVLGRPKKVPLQVRCADGELTEEPEVPAAQPLTTSDLAEFPLFVEYALQQQGVRLITVNGLTYRWAGTHYALWEKERLVRWLTSLARSQTWRRGDNEENRYHPFLTGGHIASALGWIQIASEIPANAVNPAGMVNCRNGVMEISWEGRKPVATLVPHDQDRHFFIDPPGPVYDPEADPKYADQLLECLPEDSRRLFLQIAAATLDIKTVRLFADRVPAMLMIGEGKNGKDTLREALTAIHGKSSVASMSVQDWQSHQAGSGVGRFKATQLAFAKLSVASENSGAFKIDNLETLKAAISGDPIYVERKGIDGTDIIPRAAFFFFLNRNPLLDGGGVAIMSRYAIAMLPHTYSSNPKPGQLKADTRFKHDIEWVAQNVLPGLLNKMVHYLGEVAANGFDLNLTKAPLQELREETCHLHAFMRETGYVLGDKTESVALSKFYERLMEWYELEQWVKRSSYGSMDWAPDDGDQPVKAQRLLGKRLRGLFPSVRVEREPGKTRRSRIYGIRRADAIPDKD